MKESLTEILWNELRPYFYTSMLKMNDLTMKQIDVKWQDYQMHLIQKSQEEIV